MGVCWCLPSHRLVQCWRISSVPSSLVPFLKYSFPSPRSSCAGFLSPNMHMSVMVIGIPSKASMILGSCHALDPAGFSGYLSKRKLIPIKKKIDSYQKNTLIRIKNRIPPTPLVLVCWFPGRLVLWSLCPGPLVPWSLGPSGPLVLWSLGPLVLWCLVLWSLGPLVLWSFVLVFGSLGLYFRGKTR